MARDSWVFRVVPAPGESFGHFMGRFRRANGLSQRVIADYLGVREKWVEEWEQPSRRRNPTELQRIALSKLVEVSPKQLAKMLPPARLHLQTRLCAACYGETPVHQANWQREEKSVCDRHALRLLSNCPICGAGFRTPALWEDECCEQCGLLFGQMRMYQQSNARQVRSPSCVSPEQSGCQQ
ncbi:helix-turn-helix domain-containing protein [Leptolyngbya sp. AN02str]|uniref:helix-turn-helix domain-containing protein n=1 Tax=Leptolyngbya sp. AN02str TaxID=3423363 RepID=UPI003D31306F